MVPSQEQPRELSDEAAAHVLSMEGTQSGTRTGWLMITTILIEAWDLYAISSGIAGTNFLTAAIYIIATISGFVAPLVTPRLGHRGISQWGFGGAFVSLLAAALFLHLDWKLLVPVAAATLMWSHFILPEVYGYVEHEKLVKLGTSP